VASYGASQQMTSLNKASVEVTKEWEVGVISANLPLFFRLAGKMKCSGNGKKDSCIFFILWKYILKFCNQNLCYQVFLFSLIRFVKVTNSTLSQKFMLSMMIYKSQISSKT